MIDEGNVGTATATAAGATLAVALSEDVNAGDALFVVVAWNNHNGTTPTGPIDVQIRIDDAAGNPWRLLASAQNVGSGQSAGSHGSIFGCVVRNALTSGQEITLTHLLNAALTAKAASVRRFSAWGAANILIPPSGIVAASGAGDPASIALSGLPSREYLFLNALSFEGPTTDAFTQDADYTSFTAAGTDSGTPLNDQSIRGGFRVTTATGDTVDVSADARDHEMLLVACYPSDAPFVKWSQDGSTTAVPTGTVMQQATTAAPTLTVPWVNAGDVAVYVQAGQQTVNVPKPSTLLQACGTVRLTTGDITCSVFWRRLDGTETTIVGQDVSQANLGVLLILGGCNPYGTPFINMGEGTETADTSVEVPGATTPWDDALVVAIAAHGIDSTSDQYSAWTNANLTDIDEVHDVSSTLLNGVGIGMAVGVKESAGAVGTTTATLAASDVDITTGLAFKPYTVAEPSQPYVQRVLAAGANIGALALAWSADELEADDLIVLFVNSEAQDVATPTDYTEFPDSPQDTTGCRLEAFYKVSTGAETGVTIADSGDHQIAVALCVRKVDVSGTPVDVSSGGTAASGTALAATGDTTTLANDLVLVSAAHSTDALTTQFYGFNNGDLDDGFQPGGTLIEHVYEMTSDVGAGGGVAVAAAPKASAGLFGNTTATLMTASTQAFITLALPVAGVAPPPAAFIPRVVSVI